MKKSYDFKIDPEYIKIINMSDDSFRDYFSSIYDKHRKRKVPFMVCLLDMLYTKWRAQTTIAGPIELSIYDNSTVA